MDPPKSNSRPYFTLREPSSTLYAYNANGSTTSIDPIPLSSPTRILGAFIAPDFSDNLFSSLRQQITRTKSTILRKKASLHTIWTVLRQSVYPKFTYQLKFTNYSIYDLDRISAPLRDLIRIKANATHLPNAILFSGNSTPYSLPFTDLTSNVLKEKESTVLRMLAGSQMSRQIIHCLLARGHRLISDHLSFSTSPIPCPALSRPTKRAMPHMHCWALAIIQYLQLSDSNISITNPFPHTSTSHDSHTDSHPLPLSNTA